MKPVPIKKTVPDIQILNHGCRRAWSQADFFEASVKFNSYHLKDRDMKKRKNYENTWYIMFFCSLFFFFLSPHVNAQNWPMVNGNKERTSWAWHETELYPQLEKYKEYVIDTGTCRYIVLFESVLYIGINNGLNRFWAIDSETGEKLWSFEVPNTTGSNVTVPAVNDSMFFCGGQHGIGLYALNRFTGAQEWVKEIGSLYSRHPVIDGDRIYIVTDSLYCLNISDGSTLWSYDIGSNVTPAVDDENVYVCGDLKAVSFDKYTGGKNWEIENSQRHYSSLAVDEGHLYTYNDNAIVALVKEDGSLDWSYTIPDGKFPDSATNAIAISDSFLVFSIWEDAEDQGQLYVLDKMTGDYYWHYTFDSDGVLSPMIANGITYVVKWNEYSLWGFHLKSGDQVFFDDSESYRGQPIVVNNILYTAARGKVVSFRNKSPVLEQDSLALVALYNGTDGANWADNTNWLAGPVLSWYGITVDTGRVAEIELNGNNLGGTLPEEICNLTALIRLNLKTNDVSGTLPASIGELSHLRYLHLAKNKLSGELPISIGNMRELGALYLYNNRFSGEIPETLYTLDNLSNLQLQDNEFTGHISASIGNLTGLSYLFLAGNNLSGTIPESLGNLTNLITLDLSWNQLSGPIPDSLANMTQLKFLWLSHNELSGPIPPRLGELSNLESLELHSNHHLNGSIPSELGSLANLETLFLTENELSGAIPPELGNLTNVRYMYLSINRLGGTIPSELGMLERLQTLHLYSNELVDMPDFSGSAMTNSIQEFKVQENRLTFEDIEPNLGIAPTFEYAPQDSVGVEKDTTLEAESSITFSVIVGGNANQYQWIKDGEDIIGADSSSYTIASFDSSDAGSYICRINSTIATELTLYSRPIHVTVSGEGVCERGDANCDGTINLLDLITIVNHILGTQLLEGDALWAADCNGDSDINLLDLISIANVILGLGECEP